MHWLKYMIHLQYSLFLITSSTFENYVYRLYTHISVQLLDIMHPSFLKLCFGTVNSEIFARFSRNFASAKFPENKTSQKWRNHCRLLM